MLDVFVAVESETVEDLGDLVCEFAGWDEDEGLDAGFGGGCGSLGL